MSATTARVVIPASVAAWIKPGTSKAVKLQAAAEVPALPSDEQLLLLFCLAKDADQDVQELARTSLEQMDSSQLLSALDQQDQWHPSVLHLVASLRGDQPEISTVLLARKELADLTRNLLTTGQSAVKTDLLPSAPGAGLKTVTEPVSATEQDQSDAEEDQEEQGEIFKSKYQQAQQLEVSEKIKLALTGDKEWRKILVKDSNRLVSAGVLKNPRMSEPEVLALLKSGVQNDEVMRLICANKEWVKNYMIRKALIENPKTPLANALRYLGSVTEKDLIGYSKSRNISSVIATQAKRMLQSRNR